MSGLVSVQLTQTPLLILLIVTSSVGFVLCEDSVRKRKKETFRVKKNHLRDSRTGRYGDTWCHHQGVLQQPPPGLLTRVNGRDFVVTWIKTKVCKAEQKL